MVKYGWIEDDDVYNLVPYFHGYHVDKENPGVIIKVLKNDEAKKHTQDQTIRMV